MELSTGPVLEVLGSPEALKEGERITGWAALAQDITSLYPFEGEIRTAGDDDEQPLIVAIWEFREDQERQGRYERFRGRVPIEFQSMARVNHELIVDEIVYKIQEGITNLETMTIDLVVSKHHG
jgi:hypothetical protein